MKPTASARAAAVLTRVERRADSGAGRAAPRRDARPAARKARDIPAAPPPGEERR